jgi:hypothetical protein
MPETLAVPPLGFLVRRELAFEENFPRALEVPFRATTLESGIICL